MARGLVGFRLDFWLGLLVVWLGVELLACGWFNDVLVWRCIMTVFLGLTLFCGVGIIRLFEVWFT